MRFPLLRAALPLLFASTPALAQAPSVAATEPASLWYSEQFTLHSKNVGRDFLIQVARPANPVAGKTPAVFLLDGNTLFPLAASMVGLDGFDGMVEPAFVIAVGYKVSTKAEWATQRTVDLRFAPTSAPPGDGRKGAAFARFLTTELRPLIEARYHTDPHRAVLAGHSFGGSFVTHILLNDPGAFDEYLLGSPALFSEPDLLAKAKTFVALAKTRVFLSIGEKEQTSDKDPNRWVANVRALAASLTDHASNVDLKLEVVPGEGHVSSIPIMLEDGFRFLLPPVPQ